jgi:isopentenyl-diphosphate delta-isomerase
MEEAVRRRLGEEMGLECPLEPVGTVLYRAELSGGWIEHELDHVWVGLCEEDPTPPPSEVMEWQWMSLAEVEKELAAHPERYTAWFSQVLSVYARSLPVQPSLVLSVEK